MILSYVMKFLSSLLEIVFIMAIAILFVYFLDWIGRRW